LSVFLSYIEGDSKKTQHARTNDSRARGKKLVLRAVGGGGGAQNVLRILALFPGEEHYIIFLGVKIIINHQF
jgi:hypothetical protein